LDVTPKVDPQKPLMVGKIGLGAWNTETEFKELRVYDADDKLVYSDDFTNLDGWTTPGVGRWEVADGVLRQTDQRRTPAMLLLKSTELGVGRLTVKARRVAGQEGFEILFCVNGRNRFLFCNYGANMNEFSAIQDHGVPTGLNFRAGRNRRGGMEDGRWYDISLVLHPDSAEMYLDGQRISTARVTELPSVFAAAGYDRKNKTVVLKATNYYPTPLQTDVVVDGAATVGSDGKLISISSDSLDGDNTLDQPTRIAPHETPLNNLSKNFTVTLPPYSVNVLRIPAEAN
jgi:alpha-N-arabinofuranosidase